MIINDYSVIVIGCTWFKLINYRGSRKYLKILHSQPTILLSNECVQIIIGGENHGRERAIPERDEDSTISVTSGTCGIAPTKSFMQEGDERHTE